MTTKDLIPASKRPPNEVRRLASMGGKVRSAKKRYAAKIREMRKKGDIDTNWFIARLEDPECTAYDIQVWLDVMAVRAKKDNKFAMYREVAKLKIEFMKAHHGDKKKVEISGMPAVTFVINKPEGDLPDIDFEKRQIIDAEFSVNGENDKVDSSKNESSESEKSE